MKRRRGEFIGSFAPYGYAKDPADRNALRPDPAAARVVEEIFRRRLEGEGRGTIAQALNARGEPNPTAYKARQGSRYRRPGPPGTGCGRRPPWGGSSATPSMPAPWSRGGSGW